MTNLEYFLNEIKTAALDPKGSVNTSLRLPNREWDGSFCIGDFEDAVKNQDNKIKMRRFYLGKVEWYKTGDNSQEEAEQKAKDDIGFVFDELTIRRQKMWWQAARIKRSSTCHA